MPDRRTRRRFACGWLAVPALATLAALAGLLAASPVAVIGGAPGSGGQEPARIAALAPPDETCEPNETRGAGGFENICGSNPPGSGGGGFAIGALLPILGIVLAGGVIALLAAFVVLRRTSAPLAPADPGEWWTCRNCGKNNVVGSARCYACGAWQR